MGSVFSFTDTTPLETELDPAIETIENLGVVYLRLWVVLNLDVGGVRVNEQRTSQ